jgi:energy-coupling factor transporter ATP-binding protein EcfA2
MPLDVVFKPKSELLSFEEIGLPEPIKPLLKKPRGLILVTGPTGSGKSTTLAAMIDHINAHRRCHILTLEDPVEYLFQEKLAQVSQREMDEFLRSENRARRAVALFEVGRRADARDELRNGLRTAGEQTRRLWTGLARVLGPRLGGAGGADATRIDAADYPQPALDPEGGWTLERSLVYAIARKESVFNAEARSPVGAYGMMQVMPTTAAEMTGDRGFVAQPQRLFQPATNVRLGQEYVNRMLARPEFQGDLLRAVASYNAGPGPMLGALRRLGPNPDPLLLIETIDVPQAREYVEKVVAAYWIYQRMAGRPLNTLDAVVAGQSLVPIALDYVAPSPGEVVPPPSQMAASPVLGTR